MEKNFFFWIKVSRIKGKTWNIAYKLPDGKKNYYTWKCVLRDKEEIMVSNDGVEKKIKKNTVSIMRENKKNVFFFFKCWAVKGGKNVTIPE